MVNRRTALVTAATLLLGAGLFGASALPASGDPAAGEGRTVAAAWQGIRVASMGEALRRMDAEAGAEGETLIFFSTETDSATVDVAATGISPGDFFLFEEQLYTDKARTEPAGQDSVRGELFLTYEATFKLDGGNIRISGTQFSNLDPTFAITGGTGQYLGAGGLFIPFALPFDTVLLFRVIH
ncbi:MAG: hypothetical protein ACR2JK_05210 [Geodermatophilaceae bacterium]